jgi:hypothetical protein
MPLAAAASERTKQAIDDAEASLVAGLRSPEAPVRLKAAATLLALSPAAVVAAGGGAGRARVTVR